MRCSIYVGDQPEQPCYEGVHVVPEFPFAIFVMILATGSVVVLYKTRFVNLGQM
jgi:hypothetical protein